MPEYEVEQEAYSLANSSKAKGGDIKGLSCNHETLAPKGGADLETLSEYRSGASYGIKNEPINKAL